LSAVQPEEVSVKKLVLFTAGVLLMSACAESSTAPTSSQRLAPTRSASGDLECRSGYVIAYDEFGNPYCAPVQNAATRPKP